MLRMMAGVVLTQAASADLRSALDTCDGGQANRGAIAVGQNQVLVFLRRFQLIVGVDRKCAGWSVEVALGRIGIAIVDGGPDVVDVEAVGGELRRIGRMRIARRSPPRW